jgi:hypothetical protein
MTCLPASVEISSTIFRHFRLPLAPGEADAAAYQASLRDVFTGQLHTLRDQHGRELAAGSRHNWQTELGSLRQSAAQGEDDAPPALAVWQAAGYKHAQAILADRVLKGCLFWWTPGSGKSVMVALLVELLKLERQRVLVVSTPQNTAANGRCVKGPDPEPFKARGCAVEC